MNIWSDKLEFTHIHNHTVNSLLDGLIKPENLAKHASEMGFKSVGISDHGSISGLVKFHEACVANKIKGIYGIEAYFVDNAEQFTKGETRYHICLFAKNLNGLKNIFKLISEAHRHFYYKPRFDFDMLCNYNDIIITTACESGLLSHPNREKLCLSFKERFGENFFLEIMPLNSDKQKGINEWCSSVKSEFNIIATNDIHYLKKEDEQIHNFLLTMNTKGKMQFDVHGLYMKTAEEMFDSFKSLNLNVPDTFWEESITNTQKLVYLIEDDFLEKKDIILPTMGIEDPDAELDNRIKKNLFKFSWKNNKIYKERLKHELDIIRQKGFSRYFLLVGDFIDHAKSGNIELGAGRGSAAGSLICYTLGITDLDPISHDLLFERFLNPDRIDWPDIDIDVPRSKRKIMIDYLKNTYGDDYVANISTISEMKTTSAFKDVARTLGMSFYTANYVSKYLDNDLTLAENVKDNLELASKISGEISLEKTILFVDAIRGTLRHSGKHAAGIVVSPIPLVEFGILERRKDDFCLNWDMDDIGFFGLVKIDVLGLRTLDILSEAKSLISLNRSVTTDWTKIHVDTREVLDEFGNGNTTGIFQFESANLTHLVKQLSEIKDKFNLVDMNALGRPGPLDSGITTKYISLFNGGQPERSSYSDYVKEYTEKTQGLIVYQEQIIKILTSVAGYTPAQADSLRRIFAKVKGVEEMEADRGLFVKGCIEHSGMKESVANELFNDLVKFGRYGFNKSHAAAYTELALRQMWLKYNFPLEYMAALYTWTDEEDKVSRFGNECNRLGVKLLSPDINKSGIGFSIENDGIRIGLGAIKGLGEKVCSSIMKQREQKPFIGLQDFRIRLLKKQANKTILKNLVLSGAFDEFKVNHKKFVDNSNWFENVEKMKISDLMVLHDGKDDYSEEDKHINKALLMPGIYKINMEPEIGLNIDVERLEKVKEVIKGCYMCGLRKAYNNPTGFEYTINSKIMVIAEAPGEEEFKTGRPLIGKAGRKMMEFFNEHGIERSDLYLSNVFKCRARNNKLPDVPPKECFQILLKEIEILRPKLILALGKTAMWFITNRIEGITKLAGSVSVEIIQNKFVVPIVFSIHPAALLYDHGPENIELFDLAIQRVSEIFYGENFEEKEDEYYEMD